MTGRAKIIPTFLIAIGLLAGAAPVQRSSEAAEKIRIGIPVMAMSQLPILLPRRKSCSRPKVSSRR